jgi:lysophospholipid acyltransferase (LPLAT)-like uncharacterized protein
MGSRRAKVEKGDRLWFRVALKALPVLTRAYFKLVDLTSRKVFINREYEEETRREGSCCVAGFHGCALFPGYYCRSVGGVIMVSRSWDGDLMDRCLKSWGYGTARGSSSRGGKEALQEMIEIALDRGCPTGMAVDAPRGPARKVKIGAVILARETGQTILPVTSWATRFVQFRSWDRMILPLPFSAIVIVFGKPISVPKGLSREEYEAIRERVENTLLAAQSLAEETVAEIKGTTSASHAHLTGETVSRPPVV